MMMRSVLSIGYLSLSVLAFNAFADGGTIHFVGAIVEQGCEFSHHQHHVVADCPVGAKSVKQTIAVADINHARLKSDVPATVQLHYLDDNKNLAILSVAYR